MFQLFPVRCAMKYIDLGKDVPNDAFWDLADAETRLHEPKTILIDDGFALHFKEDGSLAIAFTFSQLSARYRQNRQIICTRTQNGKTESRALTENKTKARELYMAVVMENSGGRNM